MNETELRQESPPKTDPSEIQRRRRLIRRRKVDGFYYHYGCLMENHRIRKRKRRKANKVARQSRRKNR